MKDPYTTYNTNHKEFIESVHKSRKFLGIVSQRQYRKLNLPFVFFFSLFLALPISNNCYCFNTFLLCFCMWLCSFIEKVFNASLYKFKCNKSRIIEFQFIVPSIGPDMIILHCFAFGLVIADTFGQQDNTMGFSFLFFFSIFPITF